MGARSSARLLYSTRRQTPALFVDEQLRGNDPAHLSLAALSSDLSSAKPFTMATGPR